MRKNKKRLSQAKINKMILDIIEDIVGSSAVYNYDLGFKTNNLSSYLYFGKEIKQMAKKVIC